MTPLEQLLARYERYLPVERGLAASTVRRYVHVARALLGSRESDAGVDLNALCARDVTEHVVAVCRVRRGRELVTAPLLSSAERVFMVDLHTGHGPRGEITAPRTVPLTTQDEVLRSLFPLVTATADNPDAPTRPKSGPIARGMAEALRPAETLVATIEVGTADDLEQLTATYQEQWVHRRGTDDDPRHRAARWAYRCCFTPDDPAWEEEALRRGLEHLDAALGQVVSWSDGSP